MEITDLRQHRGFSHSRAGDFVIDDRRKTCDLARDVMTVNPENNPINWMQEYLQRHCPIGNAGGGQLYRVDEGEVSGRSEGAYHSDPYGTR